MAAKRFSLVSGMLLIVASLCVPAMAGTYYVAVKGNDAGEGSKARPFATVQRAQKSAEPGDTVLIRGGLYKMTNAHIQGNQSNFACVTILDKSGTSEQRICYFASPGEQPVFDFAEVIPEGRGVSAFWVSGSWLHLKGLEVIGVQQPVAVGNRQSECFSNSGSHNIYELLKMHDGEGIGFFSRAGGYNLILNCDAYRNCDLSSQAGGSNGGNVDGFGSHYSKPGDGANIFRGCRAWYNSDDGYDCINNGEQSIFDNCWAMYNGYSYEGENDAFHSRGDGNGIKAGGYDRNPPVSKIPVPVPRQVIQYCLAVSNKSKGFDANYHADGSFWKNNTAYNNNYNYHMELAAKLTPEATNLTFVPGFNHFMINNLGYKSRRGELARIVKTACIFVNNSFEPERTFTDADFVSLDETQLLAPRKADGSLPDITFMKLKGENTMGYYGR
jgi:hypothetical protein